MVQLSSNTRICGPKSLRKSGPGMSWSVLVEANEVSQNMWRLLVGQHQAWVANWVGRQSMGMLESRCKMCDRPQKAVICCGRPIICVVEGGHGQMSDMVGAGACEMTTRDES